MPGQINPVPFWGTADPYAADAERMQRQREMAQMLAQQASATPPANQMAGRFVVPYGKGNALAQALKGGMSGYMAGKTMQDQRALSEQAQADYRTMVAKGLRELQGTPGTPGSEDPAGNWSPPQGATPGDPTAALGTFMSHPMGAQLASLPMDQIKQQMLISGLRALQAGGAGPAQQPGAPMPQGAPQGAGGGLPPVDMLAFGTPGQKMWEELAQRGRPQKLSPSESLVVPGSDKPMYTAPARDEAQKLTDILKASGIDPASPQGRKLFEALAVKTATHQPAASTQVKVDNFLPASEEAQRDFIKSTRTTYDALKQAGPTLASIEKAKALIPAARGFMGPGGETMLESAKFLNNRLGFKIDTEGVKSAEELRTRIFFNIMDSLKKMDASPSQLQQQIMMESLGKLGTDPNALGNVLDAFAGVIKDKVVVHNKEVRGAVTRGVKFPYDPTINIGSPSGKEEKPKISEATRQFLKQQGIEEY